MPIHVFDNAEQFVTSIADVEGSSDALALTMAAVCEIKPVFNRFFIFKASNIVLILGFTVRRWRACMELI